jgi:chromosome segregation ATPase
VSRAAFRGLRGLAALGALVGLAACTSPNCDPNQAGFFSGIGNAASGCYASKDAAYQQQLNQSAAWRDQQKGNAATAAANASAANQNLADAEQRLGEVRRQTAIMEGQLSAMRSRTDLSQSALRQAQQAIDELHRRQNAAAAAPTPQALAGVEAQQRSAQQRLRDLTAGQ